jgi:hypothetical protein
LLNFRIAYSPPPPLGDIKGLSAAHQLVGPAADWWDAYAEANEEPESINWQEFWNSFKTHHLPLGVMKLKKKEFDDLKQG